MAQSAGIKGADAVAELATRARNDSIGSIDHVVNAKAIALSNSEVQTMIGELLERDFQLIAIQPLRGFGSALMSFPLQFIFRAGPDSGAVALQESFTATPIDNRRVHAVLAFLRATAGRAP